MEDIKSKFVIVGTKPPISYSLSYYSFRVLDKKIYAITKEKITVSIYVFNDGKWEKIIELPDVKSEIDCVVFKDNLYIFFGNREYILYDKKTFNRKTFGTNPYGLIRTTFTTNDFIVLRYRDAYFNFDPVKNEAIKTSINLPSNFYSFISRINIGNYFYYYLADKKLRRFNIITNEIKIYDFYVNRDSTLVYYDDIIYAIGGLNSEEDTVDTISAFDINKNISFENLNIEMNEKKRDVTAVICDDSIYVMYGQIFEVRDGKTYYSSSGIIEKYILKPLSLIKQKDIIKNEDIITKNIHKSFVYSTVYNNDYTKFISTSGDSTLILWNIEHIEKKIKDIKIEKILTGHNDRVVCVAWKSDSSECASGSNDCSIIIWNTIDGSIIKKYNDHDDIVRSVDYNIIGTLASASDDKTIIVYNEEKTILHHKNRVRSIKWNPVSENLLLSGCDDFSITLWDVSNKTIIRTFKEHTNFIYSLVWNDKTKFASSSGDGRIIIWNTEEVKSTKVLIDHVGNVWSIDWKGNVLVSGGNNKKILVWNTTNYTNHELTGHDGYVLAVNIDNNRNIISGATDNMIKVW
jgi:WD40 repeat protein